MKTQSYILRVEYPKDHQDMQPSLRFQLRNIRSGECLSFACWQSLQTYLEEQKSRGLH